MFEELIEMKNKTIDGTKDTQVGLGYKNPDGSISYTWMTYEEYDRHRRYTTKMMEDADNSIIYGFLGILISLGLISLLILVLVMWLI